MITVINLVVGSLLKLITGGFSKYAEFKRHKELAILNVTKDTILALQSGTDTADPATRWTRRIIAIMFATVWCFLIVWIILNPKIEFQIFVGKHQSWFWEWLWPFPMNDKGIATISAGALLWDFKTMLEILTGFYFTKIGK